LLRGLVLNLANTHQLKIRELACGRQGFFEVGEYQQLLVANIQ